MVVWFGPEYNIGNVPKHFRLIEWPDRKRTDMATSYIDYILNPEEKIVHQGTLHWAIFIAPVVKLGIGLGLLWLLTPLGKNYFFDIVPKNWGLQLEFDKYHRYIYAVWIVLSVWPLLGALVRRFSTELVITSQRVIYKEGFIRRHTSEIHTSKIEGVSVDQPVFGRILGYGHVAVKGVGGGIAPVRYIARPLEFRKNVTPG
jgi:hypothetical protein